jgi:hypothetical protein
MDREREKVRGMERDIDRDTARDTGTDTISARNSCNNKNVPTVESLQRTSFLA